MKWVEVGYMLYSINLEIYMIYKSFCFQKAAFFPQIAIAIGVLTSNNGGGRRTTLADWTWHQGAIAGCSGRGAIAGCHHRVPL